MIRLPKFNFIEYRRDKVYSKNDNVYFIPGGTAQISRKSENEAADCLTLSLNECIDKIKAINIKEIARKYKIKDEKAVRPIIQIWETDNKVAIKEYNTDFSHWNGCTFIDLDLKNSKILEDAKKLRPDILDEVYDKVYEAVLFELNENFLYIDQSQNKGIHVIFYFNVEKTEDNFIRCVEYTKRMFFAATEKYIKGFSDVLKEPKVYDAVSGNPFQKLYCTGIKCEINDNCSGYVDFEDINKIAVKKRNTSNDAYYELVEYNKTDKKYDANYMERLRLATAIKAITPNKEVWFEYWSRLCENFKLNDHERQGYMFYVKQVRYEALMTSSIDPIILEKYGFVLDKNKFYIHLKSSDEGQEEWLGDKIPEILSKCKTGINLLIAPTGGGKTRAWIDYNKAKLEDVISFNDDHKSILVVEPLNSIIDTKYDKDEVYIVNKSKQFAINDNLYKMYVTNFNKFLNNGEVREDLVDFFGKFEFIVIDESHIMIKDGYRSDVLIPFVDAINKISKYTKVILQTATPMEEDKIFDIATTIIVDKKLDKKIKYIYRYCNDGDKFEIQQLNDLCEYYLNQNRKVYIYWNNADLNKLKSFKFTYKEPERVAIFHKRNINGDGTMEDITTNHALGDKYDVLLSSVYFGVGNDLNDECNAAVIIVGNNTWQEDIQVIGRWRNSKDIEVCVIIKNDEYYDVVTSGEWTKPINAIKFEKRKSLERIWYDKQIRDKSVVVRRKAYKINKAEDIEILSIMWAAEEYHRMTCVKDEKLKGYGIRVKPLCNDRLLEYDKEFIKGKNNFEKLVKGIRDTFKRDVISGKLSEDEIYKRINEDTKLESWYKFWKKFCKYGLKELLEYKDDLFYKELDIKYLCNSSKINSLDRFMRYYSNFINRDCDYAELYSVLWYVGQYKKVMSNFNTKKEGEEYLAKKLNITIKNKDKDDEIIETSLDEYIKILAYVMFCTNINKDSKYKASMMVNYFKDFKYDCKLLSDIPDVLINEFFNVRKIDNRDNLNDILAKNNLTQQYNKERYERLNVTNEDDLKKFFVELFDDEEGDKERARIMIRCLKCNRERPNNSRPKKYTKIVYKGVEYESIEDAVKKTGKSARTIYSCMEKNHIQ